jgi:hypothetical protein
MRPTLSVRLFAARLRTMQAIHRLLTGIDGSDLLSAFVVIGIGAGVGLMTASLGAGLVAAALATLPVTPIGTGVRILVRGR